MGHMPRKGSRKPVISQDNTLRASKKDNPFVAMSGFQKAALLILYFAYLTAALLVMAGRSHVEMIMVVLVCLYVLLTALPLILIKRPGWFHPLIWTSASALLLGNLWRNFQDLTGGLNRHVALAGYGRVDLLEVIELELLLSILSLAALYIGYLSGPFTGTLLLSGGGKRLSGWKTLPFFMLAALVWFWMISNTGGLTDHILRWAGGRHDLLGGQHYLISGIRLGIVASLVWAAINPDAMRRLGFWLAAGICGLALWTVTGGRLQTITFVLTLLAMISLLRREIPWRAVTIVGAVLVLFAMVSTGIRQSVFENKIWAFEDASPVELMNKTIAEANSRSGDSSGQLAILAKVPTQVDYLYGESYLALLTLPVPRALWSDKPGLTGGRVVDQFFGGTGGIPPGAIGEAFWNFGVLGVALVHFAWGGFLRWLTRFRLHNAQVPGATALFAVTIMMAGPTTGALLEWALTLVPLIIIMAGMGVITRRPNEADGQQGPTFRQLRIGASPTA